jgi:hypothetical protein
MKFLINFTIIYILVIVIELYLIDTYIKYIHKKDEIENDKLNNNNKEEDEFICNELKNRLAKLKNMSYNDWLAYNQENLIVNFKKEKLYVFIYDKSKEDADTFFLRVHFLKTYLNMDSTTFETYVMEKSAYFNQHKNKTNVSQLIFDTSEFGNGCSINSYLWSDPLVHYRPIIKTAISKKYQKEENGNTINGFISIGYTSKILLNSMHYYFEILENYFLVILISFIYLMIIFSLYINKQSKTKSIFLFILLNMFCVISFLSKDVITNIDFEERAMNELNSSILGISFLVSANIFIIDKLKKYKNALFYETSFLFCASLITLMLSMFKITSYFNEMDVKTHRIQNQILFNISIIINIFIFFNYFITIYAKK